MSNIYQYIQIEKGAVTYRYVKAPFVCNFTLIMLR